jgi:chitin synthase
MCYPEALGYLVRAMQNDNMIMGICGETRIANKRQSWVTMIQVFEFAFFAFFLLCSIR